MKKILVFICILVIICGCRKKDIDQIIKENNYVIVDVRTKEEYKTGHVVDSINIPYNYIGNSNLDKNKTIIVYCKSGKRSKVAYDTLKNLGYDVYDLGAYDSISFKKE